jgi:hypothetical protein
MLAWRLLSIGRKGHIRKREFHDESSMHDPQAGAQPMTSGSKSAPFIATWLIAKTGSPIAPIYYAIASATVSALVILTLRETAHGETRVVQRPGAPLLSPRDECLGVSGACCAQHRGTPQF